MADEKAIEQPTVRSAPRPVERVFRCTVCDRVLGRYSVDQSRHVIIKCRQCGALQARHLQ